ncbi:nuclease-like protein [Microcella putealis]|uniref:Nuclease-like protein n=1 Tax=Microcella putealis TaxID=337005 RepID=A0A4Q7LIV6_9MICO|nr:nuclease-like protein [Microcella putealis]TQM26892.1 nuclease-like protein [Microcella putealis]
MVSDPLSDESVERVANLHGVLALRSRAPGYAVAQKCLEVQAAAEAHDPALRTEHRTVLAPDARSWFIGAQGERHVGTILSKLGPEWLVLHAVPIGAGTKDVDHLVVGPPGVFAINTKHHRDARVWVGDHVLRLNNSNTQHLRAARSDARDASRRLTAAAGYPVSVTSVLALVGEQSIVDGRRGPRHDPIVVSSRGLLAWLTQLPRRLSDAELGHLRLVSEEPITWHIDRSAANTLRVMQRFDRLEAEVYKQGPVVLAPTSKARAMPSRRTPAGGRRPAGRSRRQSGRPAGVGLLKFLVGLAVLFTAPLWMPVVGAVVGTVVTGMLMNVLTP